MRPRFKLSSIILLLILTLSMSFVDLKTANAQNVKIDSVLQTANESVNEAFSAILDAEKAGANVTGLINQLDQVTSLLAQAENAYRTGNNNASLSYADNIIAITLQIMAGAQNAKENALALAQTSFWLTIVITIIATIDFILVEFLVWRWIRRKLTSKLVEEKPR